MPCSHQPGRLAPLVARAGGAFLRHYGYGPAFTVAAPGRVNLIGEHTDYNDGFVLPIAIDRHVVMAAAPRQDHRVRLHATDLAESSEFSLGTIEHDAQQPWSNYERGVAWALQQAGYSLSGLDIAITSDVPIASGLSSSAAVELATAHCFQTIGELPFDGVERALLCQKAENEFVGMRCGIMDQYVISLGEAANALLVDCRSLDYRAIPIASGCAIIVCNTKKPRSLLDSAYNQRRQECETGARILQVRALRDVSVEAFEARQQDLEPITRKRCRHVVTENQRVLDAVSALESGDLARFGQLMNASHASLRDDYEVSCSELNVMVDAARACPGVLGARMTGAGFGGCTVNLVRNDAVDEFLGYVPDTYEKRTGLVPEIYVCDAVAGVHRVE